MQLVSWQNIDPDKLPRSKEQLHEDWLKSRAKALGKSLDDVRKLDDAGDASLGKDPSKDVVQRTQADLAAEGIRRRPAYSREGTSISKQDIYLTLQLEFRGQKRALIFEGNPPVPEGLEFQFTKLLKELAFGRKKLGITAGNGEADPRETTVFRQSLEQLFEISEVLRAAGAKGDKLRALFVTVDPERDTPETMKSYLGSFDPRIVGLTGDRAAIDGVVKAYRAYARKVAMSSGDERMDGDERRARDRHDRNPAYRLYEVQNGNHIETYKLTLPQLELIQPHAQRAFDLLVGYVEQGHTLPPDQCIGRGAAIADGAGGGVGGDEHHL